MSAVMAVSILEDRAVLRVAGASASTFLQGLVSQDMSAAAGGLAFGALLTPQGKISAEFIAARQDDGYLLDCHSSVAEALLKKLTVYRLRAAVALERSGELAVAASTEGSAPGFAPDPRLGALGGRAILPRDAALRLANADGGAYDARRIALGVPELGKDFGPDEMFLLDVNADALNGVNYKKGCFVGQEVTSRMKRKGEVRRRTLLARFEGAPPARGAPVVSGESTLGEIMSGTSGLALANIRLDRLEAARATAAPIAADGKAIELRAPAYLDNA
ncbi:MAG: folate-binding protein YgfZ [Parvularculaceae bacterium]|nr:folate-binding protein YgfZ [Parvularculaceae bacterium]